MVGVKEIIREYKDLNLIDKIYILLRWRLCPFKLIEKNTPKEGLIVDLGCGYGILCNLLSLRSKNRNVIGFDLSHKRISIAKKSQNKNKKMRFLEEDLTKRSVKKTNVIIMTDFLHHIKYEEQNKLISKLKNKLNKRGKLIILDINKDKKIKYLFTVLLDRTLNYGEKVYYRNENEIKRMLEKNGFQVKSLMVDKLLPMPDILFIATKK